MTRKAQSWSIDVVLAIVIFGFVAIAFSSFSLLDAPDVETLQLNSQRVVVELEGTGLGCGSILEDDTINFSRMGCLYGANYTEFKKDNSIRGDFCVYLEDDNGQIIVVDNRTGWGSDEIELSGIPCGAQYS